MAVDNKDLSNALVSKSLVTPAESNDEKAQQITIIKGLSTDNDQMRIELALRGYTFNQFKKEWIRIRKPVMNDYGIGNFMGVLSGMGDLTNFSHYKESDINKLVCLFFEDNYPTFTIYSQDFELDPKDFNVIKTILRFYPLSVLNNAKNAGHRNVVRGTLSEALLQRAFGTGEPGKKGGGFFGLFKKKENK